MGSSLNCVVRERLLAHQDRRVIAAAGGYFEEGSGQTPVGGQAS